jgi:hypothetical protein
MGVGSEESAVAAVFLQAIGDPAGQERVGRKHVRGTQRAADESGVGSANSATA